MKRALVTGGTRGIGRAIAERLRRDRVEVLVTGTKPVPPEGLGEFRHLPVDFLERAALEEFAKLVRSLEIDILINNAGINRIRPFAEIPLAEFLEVEQVNLRAPFLLSQSVLPHMREKGWGRIVNICSIFGVVSRELRASYSSSKFGLDGLTAALAAEVAADGILANCVSPGFIDTELTHAVLGEQGISELVKKVPLGRLGKAEEVAELVAWLASSANSYVSGQNIIIDGGFCRV